MTAPRPKVIYRMSKCEVVEVPGSTRISLSHLGRPVATFPNRYAAIGYLAKEFVIPIRHDPK